MVMALKKFVCMSIGLLLLLGVFAACTFEASSNSGISDLDSANEKKQWTFLVYMAADNNLENAAIEDFNEMEASDFNSDEINIIVLFDRNNYKDCNDSDEWKGTRLYEILKDENGMNNAIRSKRISCKALGISTRNDVSLDMGSPKTLEEFLKSTVDFYPAQHYGLFVWGHGTGYRSSCAGIKKNRAVALDDSANSFMENCAVASAVKNGMNGKKLDFIAYDTCFGSELEVVYEFPEAAEYFIGTQNVQVESGLNYQKIFEYGIEKSETGLSAGEFILGRLSDDMKNDFSVINLSESENVFSSFEKFALHAASFIPTKSDGKNIRDEILAKGDCFRSFESVNNPVYVNVMSLVDLLSTKYAGLDAYKNQLHESLKKMIACYQGKKENLPLGIYFCSVDNANDLIMNFSPYYLNGSNLEKQCSFVKKSKGYVLTVKKSGSLLDKLFENYNF